MSSIDADAAQSELLEILQEKKDLLWLSYSVWIRLKDRNPELANQIANEYGGEKATGKGGGVQYGPASRVSTLLKDYRVGYLNTSGVRVGDIEASGTSLAVFQYRA